MLRHLPALEELQTRDYGSLDLNGDACCGDLLPHLKRLALVNIGRAALHTCIPKLRSLKMAACARVELAGALPQLKLLVLGCRDFHLSFHQMPALVHLIVYMRSQARLHQEGFSALAHLTALIVDVAEVDASSASLLLQAAPPCLRSLSLGCLNQQQDGITLLPGVGAALGSLMQLTSLGCESATCIPFVALLRRLQQLQLSAPACPADLTLEHLDQLSDITLLRRLSFGSPAAECVPGSARQCLQVGRGSVCLASSCNSAMRGCLLRCQLGWCGSVLPVVCW